MEYFGGCCDAALRRSSCRQKLQIFIFDTPRNFVSLEFVIVVKCGPPFGMIRSRHMPLAERLYKGIYRREQIPTNMLTESAQPAPQPTRRDLLALAAQADPTGCPLTDPDVVDLDPP